MPHATGLVMHISDNLDSGHRRELENSIQLQSGVSSAMFNQDRPHLMVVNYDPFQISSGQILAKLSSNKVHASRIG
jgi:hypothetical protein